MKPNDKPGNSSSTSLNKLRNFIFTLIFLLNNWIYAYHVGWQNVMDGIHAAIDSGLAKIKLNCVVMRGLNEDEIVGFVKLAQTLVSLMTQLPIIWLLMSQLVTTCHVLYLVFRVKVNNFFSQLLINYASLINFFTKYQD